MSYIVVGVESDGQIIGDNSMVCFGAVVVEPSLKKTFYGKTRPISNIWVPEALAISGFSREEHETFDDPAEVPSWKRDVEDAFAQALKNKKGQYHGYCNIGRKL